MPLRDATRLSALAAALAILLVPVGCRPAPREEAHPITNLSPERELADDEPQKAVPLEGMSLDPSSSIERQLAGGEMHPYVLPGSGQYVHAVVEQEGIDVTVTVKAPDGRTLLNVDSPSPTGQHGPEPVHLVAADPGNYRLEVHANRGAPGRYRIFVKTWRDATPADRERATVARIFDEAENLRRKRKREARLAAVERYQTAAERWLAMGETYLCAVASGRVGWVLTDLRKRDEAVRWFEYSLDRFRESGVEDGELTRVLNSLGKHYRILGKLDDAQAFYEEALQLARRFRHSRTEASCLNNLGLVHKTRGDVRRAIDDYRQALDLWRKLGRRAEEANTLANLATVYTWLDELKKAQELLVEALQASRESGDRRIEARVLRAVGAVQRRLGQLSESRSTLEQHLSLQRASGRRDREAVALKELARTYFELGEHEEARRAGEAALAIFQEAPNLKNEAEVLGDLGRLNNVMGDLQGALVYFEQARRSFRLAESRSGEASALYGAALAERKRGDPATAWRRVEDALAIVESLRCRTGIPEGEEISEVLALRSLILASKQFYYELDIDLLIELHGRDPTAGYEALAFETSERRRARTLLDVLEEALRSSDRKEGGSSYEPKLPCPTPRLKLDDIQQQLDDETLLLEYSLGRERSFLWLVTPSELRYYKLPGRSKIENLVREAHELLSSSWGRMGRGRRELVSAALSEHLLGPVADRLVRRRLLVVCDEVLQYLPFGALPIPLAHPAAPDARGEPMVTKHEIVYLPSLSVLKALRGKAAERSPVYGGVAVLADPVFSAGDPRVVGGGVVSSASSSENRVSLPRLPETRLEAEAVLDAAPEGESLMALDFDASLELVESGVLGEYRFVHFATHSRFDPESSERMALVLSLVDEQGRSRDGLSSSPEIYSLDLPVEMVTLSACRTGLGKEIRGEGLVGLTHGFLDAGAARVMSSLWAVDDKATKELMKRFYRKIFEDGQPPAAALRSAQLSMRGERRWEAPYYWAGFFLQGEWR